LHTLFTESQQARAEWKQKLDEAIGLRKVVQESNKVFELEPLSTDTFLVPSISSAAVPSWNHENSLTGKVTCSVPFSELKTFPFSTCLTFFKLPLMDEHWWLLVVQRVFG
jgi:hypothetical protein